jgi:prepilin-type N-terminal cleavage/methylation domain-containing protein
MSIDLKKATGQTWFRRAFTILEVVIALVILGMIVLAVYGAITSGMGTLRMAREDLRATQILLDKMETIRLYNWNQLDPSFVPSTFVVNYDVNSTNVSSGVLYSGTVQILPSGAGTTYADDLKRVVVRLNWKTGQISRSRELITYVCRTGLQNYFY